MSDQPTTGTATADIPAPPSLTSDEGDLDALLSNIESRHGAATQDDDDEAGGSDGVESASGEDGGGERASEPEKEEEPAADPSAPKEKPSDSEYQKALAALVRDGWSAEDIEALSPEKIKQIGLRRAKNQGDIDTKFQRLRELEAASEAGGEKEKEAGKSDPAEPAGPNLDLDALTEPLVEEFGKDGAEKMRGLLKSVADAVTKHSETQIQQLKAQVGQFAQTAEQAALHQARVKLGERFPQLKSNDGYSKVHERMKSLVGDGFTADSYESLMRTATLIEFGEETMADRQRRETELRERRDNGTPTAPSHRQAKPPASQEEQEDALLDRLEKKHRAA